MRILITRPEPAGSATAARLRAAGHDAIHIPLMTNDAVAWTAPAAPADAIMLTSAAAARLAGPAAIALHAVPCHAVGAATAAAARDAGYTNIHTADGTAQALIDSLAGQGLTHVLHLAGADRTSVTLPPGLTITSITVYRARLLPLAALPDADWALLYSARSAAHFAAECLRISARRPAIAALSPAVAAAAGDGWPKIAIAAHPDEDALLAAIGAACQ